MAPRLIIAILILIGFGCNTMNSKSQKISSDNKDQKFEYSPKDYELNKIDTTINDSVRSIVKHYTLMDSYVAPYGPVTSDSITYGYRDYAMEIELLKQGIVIINKKLLKSDFSLDKNYIKNASSIKYGLNLWTIKGINSDYRLGLVFTIQIIL